MSTISIASERPVPESIRWYYYIHLCGDQGLHWLRQYQDVSGMDVARKLDQVIGLCRRGKQDVAQEVLQECALAVQAAEARAEAAVWNVMRRWYFSTRAYLLYSREDYDGARESLLASSQAILSAISDAYFLIGLALGFGEFAVHYARIARDERNWNEMNRCFSLARKMYRDQAPLCQLGEKALLISDVEEFLKLLAPSNLDEESSIRFLLNRQNLVHAQELLIRRVELMPNVVVPFA